MASKRVKARWLTVGALLFIAFLILFLATRYEKPRSPAAETIESFYRQYLDDPRPPGATPRDLKLPFSKSFEDLVARNLEVCREKAGTDICGWGASGDLYLDAQEYAPDLTFESSGFIIEEPRPGAVDVRFNVYPSMKDAGDYYDRKLRFLMKEENGRWVVDDILREDVSDRAEIQKEIDSYSRP